MRILRGFLPAPLTLFFLITCGANAYAQAELRQKLALVKESVAENQAALRQYTWTEQTNILLKDELKKTRFDQCRYGPDGTVQKTRVGDSPSPQAKRGLRGRVIEKKADELERYIQQAVALVKDYVPPNPQQMEADFQAGNVSSGQAEPGALHLNLRNYRKPGDCLVLTFDRAARALTEIKVNTYMDKESDAVTLQVDFQKLPNGPNYMVQVVLKARAKNIQIQTTTSNYQRMQAFLQRVQTRF
jgi:hypothetical protein